jgi:flagellar biosynthetic protein FlhB
VPKATVVVTNPTHFAVALSYERSPEGGARRAPVCVAKGVDHLAQRIKEVALESGVACREDVPLARALYARVAVGQEIPEELYGAVAAVLATVYRLQEAEAS